MNEKADAYAYSDMPSHDQLGRQGLCSLFGDAITGGREPQILASFIYGANSIEISHPNTTGTGAESTTGGAHTHTTGADAGRSDMVTRRSLRYLPGFDGWCMFTAAFGGTGDANTYQRIGLYDANDGFFIGCEGATFGVTRRRGTTDTTTAITSIPGFPLWDRTKINIYRFSYGWLGVLPTVWEVYAGFGVGWVKMHVQEHHNISGSLVSIENPTLPMALDVNRTSGNGAVTITTGSWSAGHIGAPRSTLPSDRGFETVNEKTGVTTEINILTIQNKTSYQSITHHVAAVLQFMSVAVDGTKNATIHVRKGVTLGGTPSFSDINAANSVMEVDIAGTTITNGDPQFGFVLGKTGSESVNLLPYDIRLEPGEAITFSGESANSTDIRVLTRWKELF